MTLGLRQRHRRMILALVFTAGSMFVLGILNRHPVPEMETLPPDINSQPQTFSATASEAVELFEGSPVRVRLWRQLETGSLAISFTGDKSFVKPDLLAYWSASTAAKGDDLPSDATLLGAFPAGPLTLPKEACVSEGMLILYSLGDREIVDVSRRTRFAEAMK